MKRVYDEFSLKKTLRCLAVSCPLPRRRAISYGFASHPRLIRRIAAARAYASGDLSGRCLSRGCVPSLPLHLPPAAPPLSRSPNSEAQPQESRPARRRVPIQIATAFDEDLGVFSLVRDDGDEAFGVVLYPSESEWSDEEAVLNPIGDVGLPVMSKTHLEGAEGAITVAAHRLASID